MIIGIAIVSTDQADNRTGEHKIETSLDRLCDFLAEDLELTHAILLDGGAAASLVLNNELVNPLGKYYRGSGYGEARYVASAIAFVPVTPAPVDPPPTPQPSVPKPLSPQGTIGTLTPTFKWTRVANATYSLYISKAPYGEANVIFEKEDITGTSFTIPSGNLENNTKYRFDVRANLNGKWSSYSENMYFEIRVPVVRSVVSGSISNLPNGNWHIMAYDLKAQKVIGPSSEVTANNFSLDIEETSRMLALSKLDPPSGASIDPSDVQLGTMTLLVFDDTNNDGVPSVGERARLVNDPENTFPVNSDKYIQLWYSDISYQITGKSRTSTGSPVSWKIDTTNYVERWRYGLKDTGSSVEVTNSRQLKDLDLDIGRILNVSTTGSLQFEGLGGDLLID